mgnify:FL=1
MDGLNGATGGTEPFPMSELPTGFGLALAMNEAAMQGYAVLTETEKEHLILRCRDAGSKEEMERIVASLVPGESAESVIATLRQE